MQVYVLNHKSRSADPVVGRIRANGYEPIVVTDQSDFNLLRHRDKRWQGVYDNYRRIMRMVVDQHDDWAVILHDDVSVPDGLLGRVAHVLPFAKPTMCSFYNPHNALYVQAAETGHHVVQTYANFWTQCFCFHKSIVTGILDWGTAHVVVGVCAEDGYLWRYCSRTETPVQVIVPSLIQHEGFQRSTHRLPGKVGRFERRSATYDPDFDVTAIDWVTQFAAPLRDRKRLLTLDGLQGF